MWWRFLEWSVIFSLLGLLMKLSFFGVYQRFGMFISRFMTVEIFVLIHKHLQCLWNIGYLRFSFEGTSRWFSTFDKHWRCFSTSRQLFFCSEVGNKHQEMSSYILDNIIVRHVRCGALQIRNELHFILIKTSQAK